MGKPRAPTPTSKPLKGRNGNRPFENKVKLGAILRVHGGESKAAVARSISVPESTLRGWCKNEQKIRNQVQQEKQTIHSDASNSSLDSSSDPAEPSSLLKSPSVVGPINFSNAPQPFNSTSPKTPSLYTPLELDILKDPKTPQNLPLRAEIPRSNGRNKAELHRIGMGMPIYDPYNTHQSSRLLQEQAVASTSKKSSQAPATATPEMVNYAMVTQLLLQMQHQQQQQYNQQNASIQLQPKIQQTSEGRFSTNNALPSRSIRPSPTSIRRNKTTSLSSPLNRTLSPEMLQVLSSQVLSSQGLPSQGLSSPFSVAGAGSSSAIKDQELFQKLLAYHLATGTDRVQPGLVNGHSRLPPNPSVPVNQFSDNYWANLMSTSKPNNNNNNNSQFMPEQNVPLDSPPQDSPQDLRKSASPRESRSPASSVSSHHGSDFSNPGTPAPSKNQHGSNGSSPNAASPAPGHYSPVLNLSASTETTAPPPPPAVSVSQPATVAVPEKSTRCLETVLANIFKKNNIDIARYSDNKDIADSDGLFKTHLGAPIYEIEHREDGLLVGKMFYNFLNKFKPNPAITETFLGQVKHAIHAMTKDHFVGPMDQSS